MEESGIVDVSGEEMFRIVNDLCNFGYRRAGMPAAAKAEDYIFQKFREVGLPDVQSVPFSFNRWWVDRHELTVISSGTPLIPSDQKIETFPVWFSGSTGAEGITAELVYVGYGTAKDFERKEVKGKIALIEARMILNFYASWRVFGSLNLAKHHGALGMVVANGSPLDSVAYIMSGSPFEEWKNNIPALSVNNYDGQYLKSLCSGRNAKCTIKLVEEVRTEPATSNIIIGTLPGKTEDIILIGTHTDSTFTGAVDNASANAGLIELAKHYVKVPLESRDKTMVFVGWSGHEYSFLGVNKFAEMFGDMFPKIATFVMLDGFGCKGYYNQADGGVVETGTDEKRGLFVSANKILLKYVVEAAMKYQLLPATYVSAKSLPVSDLGPFIRSGVPSILVIGKPVWYHTKYDTPDKLTPEQLERTAKAHIHFIDQIHRTPTQDIKEADGKLLDVEELISKEKRRGEIAVPTISFTITPNPMVEGTMAVFHTTVFTGPESILLDCTWDFGDRSTSKLPLTVHVYKEAGTYEVTLTCKDNFGNIVSAKGKARVTR
ncbi:MAG: M28 family peptidase [Candidatus Jordarchaeum sp.]|uniref:M28 family peptidase n=1 Tax=Candidatus Jordarchaeum sp. TaxID=2823881 RepID=UPI00404B6D81